MLGYTIRKAAHEGYFVIPHVSPYEFADVLFAGTLGECLEFIRAKYQPTPGTENA